MPAEEDRHFTFTLETLKELVKNSFEDGRDLNKSFEEYWANILELMD